jgi:hypothetical protein
MPKNSRTTAAKRLRKDPLYRALGKLGRLNYPLDPAHIASHTAITECLAVLGSAGTPSTAEQRATAALKVIHGAVVQLQPERDRHMGEAIFGIGQFSGTTVGQRLERLSKEPYYISRDIYWKGRPVVLSKVMHYLRQETSPPQPVRSPSTAAFESAATDATEPQLTLETFVIAFEALRYSALAAQFVANDEVNFDRFAEHPSRLLCASRDLLDTLLCVLNVPCVLAVIDGFWKSDSWFCTPDSFRTPDSCCPISSLTEVLAEDEVSNLLSTDSQAHLTSLFERLIVLCPEFVMQAVEAQWKAVKSVSPTGSPFFDINSEVRPPYDRWNEWFVHSAYHMAFPIASGDDTTPTVIEVIAALSGQLAEVTRQNVRLTWAPGEHYRWLALKKLALLYEVDELAPDISGRSLKNRTDQYFENTTSRLAHQVITWHDYYYDK